MITPRSKLDLTAVQWLSWQGVALGGDHQHAIICQRAAHRHMVHVLRELALVGEGVGDGTIIGHLFCLNDDVEVVRQHHNVLRFEGAHVSSDLVGITHSCDFSKARGARRHWWI